MIFVVYHDIRYILYYPGMRNIKFRRQLTQTEFPDFQALPGNLLESCRLRILPANKPRLVLTDRETVQQISENPYLQYFLGFSYAERCENTILSR